jgi:hypothetical protein
VELYAVFSSSFKPNPSSIVQIASVDPESLRQPPPQGLLLASGVFNPHHSSPQTFAVRPNVIESLRSLKKRVGTVLVRVVENHGNSEWTCVYRVRVHGEEV